MAKDQVFYLVDVREGKRYKKTFKNAKEVKEYLEDEYENADESPIDGILAGEIRLFTNEVSINYVKKAEFTIGD